MYSFFSRMVFDLDDYISSSEAAKKWGISRRRVSALCAEGRILNCRLIGKSYIIPADTDKPIDLRINHAPVAEGGERNE